MASDTRTYRRKQPEKSMTHDVNANVQKCIDVLNDSKLRAKFDVCGDMIAAESKYHKKCLLGLYNRAQQIRVQSKQSEEQLSVSRDDLAFSELINYIGECFETEELAVFKLAELRKFYASRLSLPGNEINRINTTRLKERILETFPDLTAHTQGREIVLVLKQDIGEALKDVKKANKDAYYKL
ncbi:hypothetical protein AC249_AIPGENE22224 [Exaiptasia diaphana]|nr:hypothetical protein AC249_AIPGENE22224 [Exaiptasia diaphana]